PVHLRVQDLAQFAPGEVLQRRRLLDRPARRAKAAAPPLRTAPRFPRPAGGDAVEAAAGRLFLADGGGFSGGGAEGGLEGVLRVRLGAEDVAADAEDGGPVAADQGGERLLVVPGDEALQQLLVRAGELAQVVQEGARRCACHGRGPRGAGAPQE